MTGAEQSRNEVETSSDSDGAQKPFRFYDNRQKYLTFVTTCDEKWQVANRVCQMLDQLKPQPPALRVFDAGVGDGTVLSHVLRSMHHRTPSVPFYVVGKEISLEDVRLTLDKLPDRFVEHPQLCTVLTNLNYSESPSLTPNTAEKASQMIWHTVELDGVTAHSFADQLRSLDEFLVENWQVKPSLKSGNPLYVTPTALVIYRRDQRFALDAIIPRQSAPKADYDLIIASQPWRSRTGAKFKAEKILAPLSRSLRSHGLLVAIQSKGDDPGLEIIRLVWPDENPFPVNRHALLAALREALGDETLSYDLSALPDDESRLRFSMHTLPDDIGNNIGTSSLFAAWNAAVYVAQIEDERIEAPEKDAFYLDATSKVVSHHGALWFNDETFLVRRH